MALQGSVQFCLIGAGRIARVHAENISRHRRATLRYVVDPNEEARDALAKGCGAVGLPELAPALADPDVDAVLIASPTDTHLGYALAASEAGKAIFCEKPLDLALSRTLEAVPLLTQRGVPFLVAFNRRFDPDFAHLAARVRAGDIGEVELVVLTSRDPHPPGVEYARASGGLFRDMMIHDLDMARFLLGEEPVEVSTTASSLVSPELAEVGDVDTAVATLRTASGKLCTINNSRRAVYGYDQRVEVLGSKGMLQAQNRPQHAVLHSNSTGVHGAPWLEFFLERYRAAYRNELDVFVRGLLDGEVLSPGLEDAQRALVLAECCERSQREGRTVCVPPETGM